MSKRPSSCAKAPPLTSSASSDVSRNPSGSDLISSFEIQSEHCWRSLPSHELRLSSSLFPECIRVEDSCFLLLASCFFHQVMPRRSLQPQRSRKEGIKHFKTNTH